MSSVCFAAFLSHNRAHRGGAVERAAEGGAAERSRGGRWRRRRGWGGRGGAKGGGRRGGRVVGGGATKEGEGDAGGLTDDVDSPEQQRVRDVRGAGARSRGADGGAVGTQLDRPFVQQADVGGGAVDLVHRPRRRVPPRQLHRKDQPVEDAATSTEPAKADAAWEPGGGDEELPVPCDRDASHAQGARLYPHY